MHNFKVFQNGPIHPNLCSDTSLPITTAGIASSTLIKDLALRIPDCYCSFTTDCMPIPVAARSKAQVCGRSPSEIVGSNPTGGMYVGML